MAKLFNGQGGLDEIAARLKLLKARMPTEICDAHAHCSKHRAEIMASEACGCFYCMEIFKPSEIEDWVDEEQTALCAKCGIDSVIGSRSGFPVTKEFLEQMNKYWF